jgi:hypothetical protein
MGRMTYVEVAAKPADVLALTSLTVAEFQALVAPFETAFQAHMAEWTLEGKRRQNRRYTPYTNSPLPTPEDRLLFILSYLKHNVTQAYHGHLFALPQCKVNQWVHTLFPVLRATLRATGDAPSRTHTALAERLDTVLVTSHVSDDGPPPEDDTAPLFATTPPNAPSRAPRTRLNKPFITAGRPKTIRSKTRL